MAFYRCGEWLAHEHAKLTSNIYVVTVAQNRFAYVVDDDDWDDFMERLIELFTVVEEPQKANETAEEYLKRSGIRIVKLINL